MCSRMLLWMLVVLTSALLLFGCSSSDDAPTVETKGAHLYQTTPGGAPVIRVGWTDNIPDPSLVVAWLIYRGPNVGLAAENYNLTDVIGAQSLPVYEDRPTGIGPITFQRDFTYLEYGDQQDGSVDITYTRPGLAAGQSYYYRARRVVRPNVSAPPISSAQASSFDVDPPQALGHASVSQGPVTYFVSAAPTLPSNGASSIDPRHVAFQWTNSTGANEYQVRVYDNYQATGTPVLQSSSLYPTGSVGQYTHSASSALAGGRIYYWTVGARRAGEASPTCGTESGWLKSAVRQFRTVTLPPSTP